MIQAGYNCEKCGAKVRGVFIREHKPEEDIVTYVRYAAERLGDSHRMTHPDCTFDKLDVLIPTEHHRK